MSSNLMSQLNKLESLEQDEHETALEELVETINNASKTHRI